MQLLLQRAVLGKSTDEFPRKRSSKKGTSYEETSLIVVQEQVVKESSSKNLNVITISRE